MNKEYEDYIRKTATETGIPSYMVDELVEYIINKVMPGRFLAAVLANNLKESIMAADETNKFLLFKYVDFLYNYAPHYAWGSPKKVNQHCLGAWSENNED